MEKIEDIELLRALEIGLKIKTINLKGDSFSVDVAEDYRRAKDRMNKDVFIHEDTQFKFDLNIIGDHIAIDKGVYCTAKVTLGDYIHIAPYVTIIGGTEGTLTCKGFNNIMAGARVVCSSDRFDDSGIFGCLIPKKYKGTERFEPIIMEEFSNIGTNYTTRRKLVNEDELVNKLVSE